ncbi:LOW QUALITY PROTEIN: T-lymphocyte surface antigen Ly-9 [Erethizon dorsatum]
MPAKPVSLKSSGEGGKGLGASGKDSDPTVVSRILESSVTLSNISKETEIERVTWTGHQNAIVFACPKGVPIFMVMLASLHPSSSIITTFFVSFFLLGKGSQCLPSVVLPAEQLQQPQVTMMPVNVPECASCNITLMCSVKDAEKDVIYSWTPRIPTSESYKGSILTISQKPCDSHLPYICMAQNPVSQSSSCPVHTWQFHTGDSRGKAMRDMVVGIPGEPVTLLLALPTSQDTQKVVWMLNTSIISQEREEAATADPKGPDESRVQVSSQDHSLKISQLKLEDTSPYQAYVCSVASAVTSMKHITLLIYCESLGRVPVGAAVSQEGSHLIASWRSGANHPNFAGMDSNPISNSSFQFPFRDICPGCSPSLSTWATGCLRGKTPVPQENESSVMIYCSIQKPQKEEASLTSIQEEKDQAGREQACAAATHHEDEWPLEEASLTGLQEEKDQ